MRGRTIIIAALVASAVLPAAAQAAPHYYLNSTQPQAIIPEGVKIPVLSYGTLALTPAAPDKEGPIACENSAGGWIENPKGGGAGVGETIAFASWNCERPQTCPQGSEIEWPIGTKKHAFIEPGASPAQPPSYPNELVENQGKVRVQIKGLKEVISCVVHKSVEGSGALGDGDGDSPQLIKQPTFCEGESTPLMEPGTQIGGLLSTRLKFDTPGSGHLNCSGSEPESLNFAATITGSLKTFTFEGQEVVEAR